MKKFEILYSVAAPLSLTNIDTDMIIPKQFLKTIKRTGLGQYAFYDMRFDPQGNVIPDFILNQERYKNAEILVTGANFGCGSSREHAPWALDDCGIRCVIAESFADIFYNNCFENGILPAIVSPTDATHLMEYLEQNDDKHITVDLNTKIITFGKNIITFKIDDFSAKRLREGLDSIGLSLTKEDAITAYEQKRTMLYPWL